MRVLTRIPQATDRLVARIREEMVTRGFSLVSTPDFYADAGLLRVRKKRLMLRAGSGKWKRFPGLCGYRHWLESLVSQALPEEAVAFAALELRQEPVGYVDPEVDRLHADGSYIRAAFTLYGLPTVYRFEGKEESVPVGQTLVMTAQERARAGGPPCTLHRRPGRGPERAVIVCSLAPAGRF